MVQLTSDNEKLLDIGCGQGTLMELALGMFDDAVGVEPSKAECAMAEERGLKVFNSYFDSTFPYSDFSAFIMTQVLEHISDPKSLLNAAYDILKDNGIGYIDVPNGYNIYINNRFYDVYSEHLNYWSLNAITRLATDCGFYVISAEEVHGANHIAVYVKKVKRKGNFAGAFDETAHKLDKIFAEYDKVSVYGAGIKGRSFIKLFFKQRNLLHLFDGNPDLSGAYVANCAIPIEKPNEESVNDSEVIILTAIEYKEEIIQNLKEKFRYNGEIILIDELAK